MASGFGASAAAKMDDIYRYQRHFYDATRRFYLLGRDELIAALDVPDGGRVLEIGCGTGRNLIRAAERYRNAGMLRGIDVSNAMLQTARTSIAAQGFEPLIKVAAADATNFDAQALFGERLYDRVFISYTLSMIPAWREVVPAAARCVGQAGSLHIVDFGDFSDLGEIFRRAQLAWLRKFSVTPIPGLDAELTKLAGDLGLQPKLRRLYGGYAVLAEMGGGA